jgi:hypothetical protein
MEDLSTRFWSQLAVAKDAKDRRISIGGTGPEGPDPGRWGRTGRDRGGSIWRYRLLNNGKSLVNRTIARAYQFLEAKKWKELLGEVRTLEAKGVLEASPPVIGAAVLGMKAMLSRLPMMFQVR